MSPRVFAVTSLYDDTGLLSHFLEHYTRLGVKRIFVIVRTVARDDRFFRTRCTAADYPAEVTWVRCDRFADVEKAAIEEAALRDGGVEPDDFVMRLDLDEFHEYPAPLDEIIGLLTTLRNGAVRGWLVDRLAEGGILAPVHPEPDLGSQFPIGCDLTKSVLRGWTQKIMICRASARLRCGVNHDALDTVYDRPPIGSDGDYVVHHFKWTSGVAGRLRARLESADVGPEYRAECRRLLKAVRDTGRIDLAGPALHPRWLGPLRSPA